jgi:hypothetical protein
MPTMPTPTLRDSRILLAALSIACGALIAHSCMSGDRYQALGTPGAIAKFLTTSSIGDSSLSDNGMVTTNTHPFNVPSYQIGGTPVLGPSGVLYNTSGGSVMVSQTTHTTLPGWSTPNLSAIGAIDWAASDGSTGGTTTPCADVNIPSKVGGGRVLACGIHAYAQPGYDYTNSVGSCGGTCTIIPSWTTTDAMTTFPSGNVGYQGIHVYNTTVNPAGYEFDAPANTTQLVLRQYLDVFAMNAVVCTGVLSDGSATASTPSFNSATGADTYFINVWTYTAANQGVTLRIICKGQADKNVSYGNSFIWLAETMGPT